MQLTLLQYDMIYITGFLQLVYVTTGTYQKYTIRI